MLSVICSGHIRKENTMSLFSLLRSYSSDDWQDFFITGIAVIAGLAVLYFVFLRKKNIEDSSNKTSSDK